MLLNLDKGDNIQQMLTKLQNVERIENTFDQAEISQAIQILDVLTASTDY